MPGIGGSPLPKRPYRPSSIAQLGARLVAELGYHEVDVAGVSWGGGIAQQFAHQYPQLCRRLVLAATSPGAIMVPGRPQALLRMATPRRYWDKDYMRKIAPEIYGGAFRKDPSMIGRHAEAMFGAARLGIHLPVARHGRLDQPALAEEPAAADPHSHGPRRPVGAASPTATFWRASSPTPASRSSTTDIFSSSRSLWRRPAVSSDFWKASPEGRRHFPLRREGQATAHRDAGW